MSVQRKRNSAGDTADGFVAGFAVTQHQIEFAAEPATPVRILLASSRQSQRLVGRPWYVWKDNPELARMINDRLAGQGSN